MWNFISMTEVLGVGYILVILGRLAWECIQEQKEIDEAKELLAMEEELEEEGTLIYMDDYKKRVG